MQPVCLLCELEPSPVQRFMVCVCVCVCAFALPAGFMGVAVVVGGGESPAWVLHACPAVPGLAHDLK
jgi:hypothetical protein